MLQFHQVQSSRRHRSPQQLGERGHGRNGPTGSLRGIEETVARDEGYEELPVAGRQYEGDRSYDASLSTPESKLEASRREGLRTAKTARESSLRGQQVLSRALARRSRLPHLHL